MNKPPRWEPPGHCGLPRRGYRNPPGRPPPKKGAGAGIILLLGFGGLLACAAESPRSSTHDAGIDVAAPVDAGPDVTKQPPPDAGQDGGVAVADAAADADASAGPRSTVTLTNVAISDPTGITTAEGGGVVGVFFTSGPETAGCSDRHANGTVFQFMTSVSLGPHSVGFTLYALDGSCGGGTMKSGVGTVTVLAWDGNTLSGTLNGQLAGMTISGTFEVPVCTVPQFVCVP